MFFFLGEMKFSKVLELQFLDVLTLCLPNPATCKCTHHAGPGSLPLPAAWHRASCFLVMIPPSAAWMEHGGVLELLGLLISDHHLLLMAFLLNNCLNLQFQQQLFSCP